MNIDEAGIDEVRVENPLVIGGSYAITFDYETIKSATLKKANEEIRQYTIH